MTEFFRKLFQIIKAPFLLVGGILLDIYKILMEFMKKGAQYVYDASDTSVKNIIILSRSMSWKCQYYIRNTNASRLVKPTIISIVVIGTIFFFMISMSAYFFIVPAGDRAVVTRFGKVDRYIDSGLGFRFPLVEKYYIVESEMIREQRFGFRQGPNLNARLRQLSNPQEKYVMNIYQKDVELSELPDVGPFSKKGSFYNEIGRKQRMTHDYLRRQYSPPLDKSAQAIKRRTEVKKQIQAHAKRLGMRPDGKISVPRERQLLTGDMSIVLLEWTLQYVITDVKSYLFNSRDVEQNIRDIGLSVMNEVIGEFRLEEVITTGRKTIELAVQQRVQKILNEYDVGIAVTQVVILNALPPKRVEFAFDEVNKAAQDMENLKYQAEIEYLKVIPEAEGKASRIIKQAEAYAVDVINKAEGEAGQFILVNKEYLKSPGVTEDRIYIETMENVFKNTPTIIMDSKIKGIMPIFMGNGPKRQKNAALLDKELEKLVESSALFKEKVKQFSEPNNQQYSVIPKASAVRPDSLRRANAEPYSSVPIRKETQNGLSKPILPRQTQMNTTTTFNPGQKQAVPQQRSVPATSKPQTQVPPSQTLSTITGQQNQRGTLNVMPR
jgi:HflK protein